MRIIKKRFRNLLLRLILFNLIIIFFLSGCATMMFTTNTAEPIVTVYNGNYLYCSKLGIKDIAREMNMKLVRNGYIVGESKNIANYKVVTEIIYNPNDKRSAKEIKDIIGVGRLLPLEEMPERDVQVILGMDSVISTFPMIEVEHKILILNSTNIKNLGEYMTEKLNRLLGRKYPFYSPDHADRYYTKTMIYYPPELENLAKDIKDYVGEGSIEVVENLKDVIVVLGLEFDPELNKQLGYEEEIPDILIVVDKTDFRLEIYDFYPKELIDDYSISIGENPDLMNKKEIGDNRTPEGKFRIVSIEDSLGWTLDGKYEYGPWFIRLENSRWKSIGILGVDEKEKISRPASRGCILIDNNDLEELVKMIKIGTVVEIRH